MKIAKYARYSNSNPQKVIDARINRAIVGLQIPLLSIRSLYAKLEHAINSGMTDEYLREAAATFPGVQSPWRGNGNA